MSLSFFLFGELELAVIVRFTGIGGIIYYHCLNCLFIKNSNQIRCRCLQIPCDFNTDLNVWWNNKYINWSNTTARATISSPGKNLQCLFNHVNHWGY